MNEQTSQKQMQCKSKATQRNATQCNAPPFPYQSDVKANTKPKLHTTRHHTAMRRNTIPLYQQSNVRPCIASHHNALHCNPPHCKEARQHNASQRNAIQCNAQTSPTARKATHRSAPQLAAKHCNTTPFSNALQGSAISLHCTALHHNPLHLKARQRNTMKLM